MFGTSWSHNNQLTFMTDCHRDSIFSNCYWESQNESNYNSQSEQLYTTRWTNKNSSKNTQPAPSSGKKCVTKLRVVLVLQDGFARECFCLDGEVTNASKASKVERRMGRSQMVAPPLKHTRREISLDMQARGASFCFSRMNQSQSVKQNKSILKYRPSIEYCSTTLILREDCARWKQIFDFFLFKGIMILRETKYLNDVHDISISRVIWIQMRLL